MNVLTRIKILYTQDCGESPTLQPTRLSIPPSSQRRLRSRARKTLDTREATGYTAENMGIQSANQAKNPGRISFVHFQNLSIKFIYTLFPVNSLLYSPEVQE